MQMLVSFMYLEIYNTKRFGLVSWLLPREFIDIEVLVPNALGYDAIYIVIISVKMRYLWHASFVNKVYTPTHFSLENDVFSFLYNIIIRVDTRFPKV